MDELYTKIIDVDDGTIWEVPKNVEMNKNVEYPSNYFTDDRKLPVLKIQLSKDSDLKTARSWVLAFISGEKIGPGVAVEYLFHLMSTVKGELKKPWITYKNIIVVGEIDPLSLITVKTEATQKPVLLANPQILDEKYDIYLLIMIMGLYRYANTHVQHQSAVATRIESVVAPYVPSTDCVTNLDITNANQNYIKDNTEFRALASAMDMFLERFPSNKYSKSRIGSIILRYQGCSGFADLQFFASMLNKIPVAEALVWFFSTPLKMEVRQMLGVKEDFGVNHSYFPYMLGLGLSEKSPFSVASNPSVHMLTHTLGSLMGVPRSVNAIMTDHSALAPIVLNAAIIFIANKRLIHIRAIYYSHEDGQKVMTRKIKDAERRKKENQDGANLTQCSPAEVLSQYIDNGFRFSKTNYKLMKDCVDNLTEVRTGTIGEWVSKYFMNE